MGIEFNDESQQQRAAQMYAQLQSNNQSKGLEQWLITKGIAKDAQQSKIMLLGTAILFFLISGYFIYKMVAPPKAPVIPPEERQIVEFNQNVR